MSAPDTPPNLEPELPEMATLREWSRYERPGGDLRHGVKKRVWQTLAHTASKPSSRPRGSSWTRALIAAAVIVAVPGAFAATETGRHWAREGLSMLRWVGKTVMPREPAARPRETRGMPHLIAPTPSSFVTNAPEMLPPPAVTTAPEVTASTATAPITRSGDPVRAAPMVGQLNSSAKEPVHGRGQVVASEQLNFHQLQAERRVLESARLSLSRRDYASARAWCRRHRRQFDKPILIQERETLEALVVAGEKATAGSKKYREDEGRSPK